VALAATVALGAVIAAPAAAQSPAPVSGGILRFARNQEPTTLNPIGCYDNGCIWALTQIFDQLVDVSADGLVPGLAESWTSSDDGLVWTFKLREAKFSNGDPVTALSVTGGTPDQCLEMWYANGHGFEKLRTDRIGHNCF
jgi:peptide/nickel transport system substrate-binding protein